MKIIPAKMISNGKDLENQGSDINNVSNYLVQFCVILSLYHQIIAGASRWANIEVNK